MTDARQLVSVLIDEDESPKDFIKRRGLGSKIKPVADFEIRLMGIENSQYFQGAGTSGTSWDAVFVGIGDHPHEALDNALDEAGSSEWNVDRIENTLPETPSVYRTLRREASRQVIEANPELENDADELDAAIDEFMEGADNDLYYYVALYLRKPGTSESLVDALLEGRYQRHLDWIMQVRAKHAKMKEVRKMEKDLENIDKPDKRKKKFNLH